MHPRYRLEAGYGTIESKDDRATAERNRWHAYYVQVVCRLQSGLSITPEVGVVEDRDSAYKHIYAGAKWQLDF